MRRCTGLDPKIRDHHPAQCGMSWSGSVYLAWCQQHLTLVYPLEAGVSLCD
jgi:hypothetical protein